ncbi:putative quinol monooxygenase [Niveibacterium sp. SC-1]|uniref:putative quinol monooxygenase n=1 Tax=Niveibacterium sp. SC-1 TaxID=3135646 RepID=UPI00311DFF08
MNQPVHVITLAEVLPPYQNTVIETLRHVAELTRQEEGCLRFDVYCDRAQPTRINTIETWADEEALKRHRSTPYVNTAILSLVGKVAGIPQMRVLNVVDQLD